MQSFLASALVVAIAEIGDKTQLLALVLSARFRKPGTVVLAIAVATLANHALAALAGSWIAAWLAGPGLRWAIAATFIAVGVWALFPDRLDERERARTARFGAFGTTLIAFFLVEIGDKTQIATAALAAHLPDAVASIVLGTTIGMLIANAPIVWLGNRLADRLPLRAIRIAAAAVFVALGIAAAFGFGMPAPP